MSHNKGTPKGRATQQQPTSKMSTGSSSSSKTPPKKTEVTKVTRSVVHSEELKEVEEERAKSLDRAVNEKRKLYKCGSRYNGLSNVPTWKEHASGVDTGAVTSPKKKKSSESKGGWTWSLFGLLSRKKKSEPKVATSVDEEVTYTARDDLNQKVSIWRGDITTLEIDAIVNAANESLLGGGGVDGAIHSAAGGKLKKECAKLNGCKTGEAKITAGYDLPAKFVIHTVGPIGQGERDLRNCYTNSLEHMKTDRLKSIAFPCISTGIYGYPNDKAANLAMKTVREWLENDDYGKEVERVIFCLFLQVDVDLYNEGMRKYFPLVVDSPNGNGAKSDNQGKSSTTKETDERHETKMEVDADDDKKTKDKKEEDSGSSQHPSVNDVEMTENSSDKDHSVESSSKPDKETEKKEKKAESGGKSEKVMDAKGDNEDGKKGDNPETEQAEKDKKDENLKADSDAKKHDKETESKEATSHL